MKTVAQQSAGLSPATLEQIRQNLTLLIGAKGAEQFIRAEVIYNEQTQKEEPKEEEENGREELENLIRAHFLSIGIPEENIATFLSVQRSVRTLRKITAIVTDSKGNKRYQGLPTREEYDEYSRLPKNLDSLNKIKHPLLYNWTPDELIEAMSSYIGDNAKKYFSRRCDIEECKQNGSIGLMYAIRTDAGMAPFAKHSFSRIRTSTRRPSAQSGVVKMPEKRPSVTEVLELITVFLTGKAKQYEQDQIAKHKENKKFSEIVDEVIIQEIKDDVYNYFVEIMVNEKNLLGPIGSTELDTIAKDRGFNSYYQMSQEADKSHDLINHEIGTPQNWQFRLIQKLGQKDVYVWVVSGRFNLRNMDSDILDGLVDYLNQKFNMKVSLGAQSADRIQCVSDLVQLFAVNPDFHGNPVSLDGGGTTDQDEGVLTGTVSYSQRADLLAKRTDGKYVPSTPFEQPDERAEQKETIEKVQGMIQRVGLSDKQRVVFENIHGLCGRIKMEGSLIAKNFGNLTGGEPGKGVSRQRIAQFQEASDKKLQELAWTEFEEDPKFYGLIKTAMKSAGLSAEENSLLVFCYGLDGMRIWEIADIARHYDTLVGPYIKDKLAQIRSEKHQLEEIDSSDDEEADKIQDSLKKLEKELNVCIASRVKYVQKKLKGAQLKILRSIRC